MKKRLACALLALVLLVGLVPVTASAAENKVSEAAITVLKQMTPIKLDTKNMTHCYHVIGKEFRIGYGTVCEERHSFDKNGKPKAKGNDHTMTQLQADKALRAALGTLDTKINSFASKNGLSLSQNQHDALVVFTYGAGDAWLSGTGALKSAIVSKAGANELLNVMKNLNDGQFSRHQVEVNMYVNGQYSNTIPATYKTVFYDPNGGSLAQGSGLYTMEYDTSKTIDHPKVTNSDNNKIFLGWYTSAGQWKPKLDKSCAGVKLYAIWQSGYGNSTGITVNYKLSPSQLVSKKMYTNLPTKPTEIKDATVEQEVSVQYDYIDKDGVRWSYIPNNGKGVDGWVKVGTPKADDVASSVIATATVTYNGYLNVRSGAGTDNQIVGALYKDDTVDITEIKTVNGHRWGKCDAGWICLTYTTVIMRDGKTVSDVGLTAYAFTGKAAAAQVVRVAPGTSSRALTYLNGKAKTETTAQIKAGCDITLSNLTIAGGNYWAKATWKNEEKNTSDKDVKVTRSGWIQISTGIGELQTNAYIELDPVMFTVVAAQTNVRANAGDGAALKFTLDKGVEMEVNGIQMVGENLWGHVTRITAVDSGSVSTDNDGWINLATKYVKRSSEVTIDKDETNHDTGLIATVINTDSVRVRKTGALYGAVIGSLKRGTTVRVWESKKDEWYKLDTNQNGVYDYEKDGWVSAKYLNVRVGTIEDANKVTDSSGNTVSTDGTGTGIVANTYSGVNVRQGAGIGYAAVGKLLPGTKVEILEVKTGGAARWGRTDKGWVCMDYISMVKYNPAPTPEDPNKGTGVGSLDEVAKTTTTAIYTGKTNESLTVYKEPIDYVLPTLPAEGTEGYDVAKNEYDAIMAKITANTVKTLAAGDGVTVHELAAVTQTVRSDKVDNKFTTVTSTSYWARINEGWVRNPETSLALDALDEKVHTLTGSDTLKVRAAADQSSAKVDVLEKGDQVKVTELKVKDDKVWGRIETEEGTGYIRMDYMSEGAYYVNKPAENQPAASEPVFGSTGNTGTGGFVTNSSGYKYKGKVIRASEVNVRASASTGSKVTTKLRNGASLVIYETTISENMAWGRCDAGWIYLYYVDLEPCVSGAVDARVVYNDNTVAYSDVNCTTATGTYARMSVVDIYEIVGKMAKTDLGWINTDNLL